MYVSLFVYLICQKQYFWNTTLVFSATVYRSHFYRKYVYTLIIE